ncbi:hypothetical protein Pjdr2_1844 [Paenibacillus sp. JDR-2]|nr:hypothetical protein Pjdr2_1844 [Paenibacillus sp. JDR-2]
MVVMEKKRPEGSHDEGFYNTRWGDVTNASQWSIAW